MDLKKKEIEKWKHEIVQLRKGIHPVTGEAQKYYIKKNHSILFPPNAKINVIDSSLLFDKKTY